MSQKFLIPLVAAAFLVAAPAFAPAPIVAGLSASAETSENTKKSTSNRMGGGPGKKAATTKTAPSAPPSKGQSTY